jgi:hypothetical protein
VDEPISMAEQVFIAFGLGTQALLLCYFAARRWSPSLATRFGWVVYALSALGLPLGVWLLADGQSWRLFVGPLLVAAWAAYGAYVDLLRPRTWRVPIDWSILAPYVALYLSGQMFMWWPLWTIERSAWLAYLALFIPSTILNIAGHRTDDDQGG